MLHAMHIAYIAYRTGVHVSKEALVPSESRLEALGLGPVAYSALSVLPIACGIFSPVVWGKLWDRRPCSVLLGAPIGELAGAITNLGGSLFTIVARSLLSNMIN